MFRQIFVGPLSLENCMQDRDAAAAAAVAIATCLMDHPSCGKLLIEPHLLTSDLSVNEAGNAVEVSISCAQSAGYRYHLRIDQHHDKYIASSIAVV